MSFKRESSRLKPLSKSISIAPTADSPGRLQQSPKLSPIQARKPSGLPKLEGKLSPTPSSVPKSSSKMALNSIVKPQSIDMSNMSPPLMPSNSSVMSAKSNANYSDFMLSFYRSPQEKVSMGNTSFVSFREMASIQAQNTGKRPSQEIFQPSHHSNKWRDQLHFNKKHEGLFRQTIHDVFRESQDNFAKVLKERERRQNVMKNVKVYQIPLDLKNEQSNKSTASDTEDQDNEAPAQNKSFKPPGHKLPEYANRMKLGNGESFKFYEYPPNDTNMRMPNAREGATLTVVGTNMYLYGGVSRELHSEIEVLNTVTYTWDKLPQKGDVPPFGRLGHSTSAYQNAFVIFGGEKSYNVTLKIRDCLNDTRIYVPATNEWKYLKCYGEHVESRRNHTGTVVGKHLVVYGGIDSNGNYLNDLKILDITTHKWSTVDEVGKDSHATAFHQACLVLQNQRKDVNVYKLPEMKTDDSVQKVAEEGIYFFGGKTEGDLATNALKILKIGSTPFRWTTPVTEGRPPVPRYSHVMVHCRKLNMLVVHGGRSDVMHSSNTTPFLGDFHVLQLENLTWVSVILKGAQMNSRCSHTAAVVGTKILIFGGIYYGVYCPPEAKVFQMDQLAVHKLEMNKRESRKSVEIVDNHNKPDQILMDLNSPKSYDNMTSYLPMPKSEKLKRLQTLAKAIAYFKSKDQ